MSIRSGCDWLVRSETRATLGMYTLHQLFSQTLDLVLQRKNVVSYRD